MKSGDRFQFIIFKNFKTTFKALNDDSKWRSSSQTFRLQATL